MENRIERAGVRNNAEMVMELLEERIVLDGDMMDGNVHDLGDGTTYQYHSSGDWGEWVIGAGTELGYEYGTGNWWIMEDSTWSELDTTVPDSTLFYNGAWMDLYNGQWFMLEADRYGYFWSDQTGYEAYFCYDYTDEQWWHDENGYYEADGWSLFGDEGTADNFIYDGIWYQLDAHTWFIFQENQHGRWWTDLSGSPSYLSYDYDNELWFIDSDGDWQTEDWEVFGRDGASSDFVYDGEWYLLDDGRWLRYDAAEDAGYFWFDDGSAVSYFKYDYDTGQWHEDADTDWTTDDWIDIGDTGADPVFILGDDWDYSYDDTVKTGYWESSDGTQVSFEYDRGRAQIWIDDTHWELFQQWYKDLYGDTKFNDWEHTYYDSGDPDYRNFTVRSTLETGVSFGSGEHYEWTDYYTVYVTGSSYTAGARNEIIYGTAAADDIDASGRNYQYIIFGGSGADTISGGELTDVIYGYLPDVYDPWMDATYLDSIAGDGTDNGAVVETIYGRGGDDEIYGGAGNDDIRGGAGNDMLYGQAGEDTVYGDFLSEDGSGSDTIIGGHDDDVIYGDSRHGSGSGDDLIYGDNDDGTGSGNDVIFGDSSDQVGSGDDTIYGGDGADNIVGDSYYGDGSGADVIDGEAGRDTIYGDSYWGAGYGDDTLYGSGGVDELYGDSVDGAGYGNDIIDGGDKEDTIFGDSHSGNGSGADTITGGNGDDLIFGDSRDGDGTGNDDIYGGWGMDRIYGDTRFGNGSGSDYIEGNEDSDDIYGDSQTGDGSGDDIIYGDNTDGSGNPHDPNLDTIFGDTRSGAGSGNDMIYGGDFRDVIYGDSYDGPGSGDDIIEGNLYADEIYGDSYSGDGSGSDTIDGGWGDDTIYGDTRYGNGSGDDFIEGGNQGADVIYGDSETGSGAGNDTIYGGNGSDSIWGDSYLGAGLGDDTIYAGAGDDYVWGDSRDGEGFSNDVIYGGAGNDHLYGDSEVESGSGDDILYGGTGNDDLYGDSGTGVGSDTFYTWYASTDTVHDQGTGDTVITLNEYDPPLIRIPEAQTTLVEIDLYFGSLYGNFIGIAELDDTGSDQLELTLTATNGTLTLASLSGLTFTAGDGDDDATMTFNGTWTDINAALDGLIFTPTSGYSGAASIELITEDLRGTGTTRTETVDITVDAL